MQETLCTQASSRSQRRRRNSQRTLGPLGQDSWKGLGAEETAQRWGGQGLKFFTEEASGSLVSGRGCGGRTISPSGVELLLLGGFLVGAAIGLFGLLQGVTAFVLLLHPI